MKDVTLSYLDGLFITVPRRIPDFQEACTAELGFPQPFTTPTWTRTFVAFDDQHNCKITDGSEFLEYLKKEKLVDGFLPISREQYQHLYGGEFQLTEGKSKTDRYRYDREGTLEEAMQNPILKTLIPDDILRKSILQEKRKGLENYFDQHPRGMPIVWIEKENEKIPFYMSPVTTGRKENYLVVGGKKFRAMNSYDSEEYHFLRRT